MSQIQRLRQISPFRNIAHPDLQKQQQHRVGWNQEAAAASAAVPVAVTTTEERTHEQTRKGKNG